MDFKNFELIQDTITKNSNYKSINSNSTTIINNKLDDDKNNEESNNESYEDSNNESYEESNNEDSNEESYEESYEDSNKDGNEDKIMWIIMLGDRPYYVSNNKIWLLLYMYIHGYICPHSL